ncbi:M14 family zinc carboxypeptidase [Candidatus Zixiibacteriota bacterium]
MRPGWYVLFVFLFMIFAFTPEVMARSHQPYLLARVSLEGMGQLQRLSAMGLDVVKLERDSHLEFVGHQPEIEELRALGFEIEVLIEDMEEHYARGRKGDNFGDLLTYSEMIDQLDAIHAAYPGITTARDSIGSTHEGRALWAIKVSDNPDVQENEPEILFDALHHAREPITVSVLLNTLNYLCANYGSDPEVTFLVDNRQIWFVPIVNPDGYIYNETNYPSGGGMWRKNRRDNGGGTYGVDLNRNYPYQWGGAGSSGDPDDDLYRGPSAGSEPETQAMMSFISSHQFVTQNSYHSVVGSILFPWGYRIGYCPEDSLFRAMAGEMASDNGYDVGTVHDILNYLVSGGTFDWSYGNTTAKPKIYAFSTEVGGSGFWPEETELPDLVEENLYSDLYLMQVADVFLNYVEYAIQDADSSGLVDPGESVLMTVTLKNDTPLFSAQGVNVVLLTDDPYVQLADAQSHLGNLPANGVADNSADPFSFSVSAGCPQGHPISFVLRMDADGVESRSSEEILLRVGQLTGIYANDFESSSDWTQDPTHEALTGDFVRIDPNPTDYQPGDDTTIDPGIYAWITAQNENSGIHDVDAGISATRSPSVDLSTYPGAHLSMMYFHGQRDPGDDPGGDYFRIDLSNDGGNTYPVNLVAFGDTIVKAIWRPLEVDLHHVIALSDAVRIRVQVSEAAGEGDIVEGGIDDVAIVAGSGNTPPPAPVLSQPADGDSVANSRPLLVVENAIDPDGDVLSYSFRVYGDSLLTDLVASVDALGSGVGTTSWQLEPPLAAEGAYWWRAFAADSLEWGPASGPASFHYAYSGPPPVADLKAYKAGDCLRLVWAPVPQAVSYVIYRDELAGFSPVAEDSLGVTSDMSFLDCDPVIDQTCYVVQAVDAGGLKSEDSAQVGQFKRDLDNAE